ncbi:MAG: hypothetical protein AABY22_22640 [Nanoarchaeota archaeon]
MYSGTISTEIRGDVNTLLAGKQYNRRNLTILPNDNGLFTPNFSVLRSTALYTGSYDTKFIKFRNDFDNLSISEITLRNMTTSALGPAYISASEGPNSRYDVLVNIHSGNLSASIAPNSVYSIPQSTRDFDSNMLSWFNISNVFYGKHIQPATFSLKDSAITGSNGAFSITIQDDGAGNLYRADALTQHAKWNSVGCIFYDEGIVLIKSPHVMNIGKEQFVMEFSGTQNVHVSRIYIKAPAGLINSSSHPNYVARNMDTTDNYVTKEKSDSVIITGVNLYNADYNIVGKISLAQSIEKYTEDEFLIKISLDW